MQILDDTAVFFRNLHVYRHRWRQERTGPPACARWTGWFAVLVGRHVKCEVGRTTCPVNRDAEERRERDTQSQRGWKGRREWNGRGALR